MKLTSKLVCIVLLGMLVLDPVVSIVWTYQNPPTTADHKSVAFGNNRWIILGRHRSSRLQLLASSDLVQFSGVPLPAAMESSPSATAEYVVAFANNRTGFLAVPVNSPASPTLSSSDGIKWITHQQPRAIAFGSVLLSGNGLFVSAVGSDQVHVSLDGFEWRSSKFDCIITSIVFTNGRIYLTGAEASGRVFSSADGFTWRNDTIPHSTSLNMTGFKRILTFDVSPAGDGAVVLETANGALVSVASHQTEWRPVLSLPPIESAQMLRMGSTWFLSALMQRGYLLNLRSTDAGRSWDDITAVSGGGAGRITSHGGILFAVGPRGLLLTSRDGHRWSQVDSGIGSPIEGISYSESIGKYILITHDSIYTSPSGSMPSWNVVAQAPQHFVHIKSKKRGEIFAGFDKWSNLTYSHDLSSWSSFASPIPRDWYFHSPVPVSSKGYRSYQIHQLMNINDTWICVMTYEDDTAGRHLEFAFSANPAQGWESSAILTAGPVDKTVAAYGNGLLMLAVHTAHKLQLLSCELGEHQVSCRPVGFSVNVPAEEQECMFKFVGAEDGAAGFFAVSCISSQKTFFSRDGSTWLVLPVPASSVGYFAASQTFIATAPGTSFVSADTLEWLPDVPVSSVSTMTHFAQSSLLMNGVAVSKLDNAIFTGHL